MRVDSLHCLGARFSDATCSALKTTGATLLLFLVPQLQFKATEPYFDDYRTFPIEEAIAERGFEYPQQLENTPRHRTIVAYKQ